jgi:hypothetical protein
MEKKELLKFVRDSIKGYRNCSEKIQKTAFDFMKDTIKEIDGKSADEQIKLLLTGYIHNEIIRWSKVYSENAIERRKEEDCKYELYMANEWGKE